MDARDGEAAAPRRRHGPDVRGADRGRAGRARRAGGEGHVGVRRAASSSLTNLDKVLFPARDDAAPFTKRDLIRYYALRSRR